MNQVEKEFFEPTPLIIGETYDKFIYECDCISLTGEPCHTCEKCGGEGTYVVLKRTMPPDVVNSLSRM